MTKLDVLLENPKPSYSCGDLLQGKCILTLSDSLKFQTFYIELEGESYAHWTRRSNKKTRHYTSRDAYIQLKQILLVSNDTNNHESIILQPGVYQYNFSFQIPLGELPSSFQSITGHIRYWLKAKVVRNWAPDVKTVLDFAMYNPPIYDPNMRPIEIAREKVLCCLCCESEPITIQATLNKTGFQVGENVLITATFCNPTDRDMTPKAKIMTRATYYARGAQKVEEFTLCKLTDQLLTQDDHLVWTNKELLIPHTVNSIINCQNIRLEHFVKVNLDIPGSINVNIECPIIIGLPALNPVSLSYPTNPNSNIAQPPYPNFNSLHSPYPTTNPSSLPQPHIIPDPHQPLVSGYAHDGHLLPTVTNQPQPSAPFHNNKVPEVVDNFLPSYQEYTSGSQEIIGKE